MSSKVVIGKASFMITIIIVSVFYISFVGEVLAADEDLGCCEMTSDGEACRYTSIDKCDIEYSTMPAQSCEVSTFCKTGCCISSDGICTKQVSKAACEMHEGYTWDPDASCSLEQCTLGCCVIGEATCAYTTERRCSSIHAEFPEAEFDFRMVDSEFGCTDICRQSDMGCCIKEDGCTWSTRGNCGMDAGTGFYGFYNNQRCSSDKFYEMCGCTSGEEINSYDCLGDEDVHWVDSCGNDDGIAEDCDYGTGTLCGHDEEGDAYCKSVNCESTTENVNVKTGHVIDDYTGDLRKNGESWCVYDGSIGPNRELVGSRHFRVLCINGEEVVDPCRDYREEICFQMSLEGYDEAGCMENEAEECLACNTHLEVEDNSERNLALKKDEACCGSFTSCLWRWDNPETEEEGSCYPLTPLGSAFWESLESADDSSPISEVCEEGSKASKAHWVKDISTKDSSGSWKWECKGNCDIYKEEYFEAINDFCKSKGDCGAHFNYVGEFTDDGSYRDVNMPGGVRKDMSSREKDRRALEAASDEDLDNPGGFDSNWGVVDGKGFDLGELDFSALFSDPSFRDFYGESKAIHAASAAFWFATGWFGVPTGWLDKLAVSMGAKSDLGARLVTAGIGISVSAMAMLGVMKLVVAIIGSSASIPVAGWIVAGVAAVIAAILLILGLSGDAKDLAVDISCLPWQPPTGGDDCHLCDEDSLKPCSEYRCRSLGATCNFIQENEGSGRESCYSETTNLVTRPKISPWADEGHPLGVVSKRQNIEEDYTVEEFGEPPFIGGYRIKGEIPSYSRVNFGIKTDQLAQCKIADAERLADKLSEGITYNDLNMYMPDSYYSKEHNFSITALAPATTFRYYVICRNPNGIPEEDEKIPPYVVEFTTDDGPDLEAPMVVGTSIPNGGKVKADAELATLSLFVDEVSLFRCKMSSADKDYELMEKEMGCTSIAENSYFEDYAQCSTQINITEGENTYYFRCKDENDNANSQGYEFKVSRSKPLEISQTSPSGTLYTRNVTMQMKTRAGADDGKATCYYEGGGCDMTFFSDFYETENTEHLQVLSNLPKCDYLFDITCHDSVDNYAYGNITFNLDVDLEPPQIINIYKSGTSVNLMLDEEATCEYSNSTFIFGKGTVSGTSTASHTLSGMEEYYLQCQDKYSNLMPEAIIRI